MKKTHWIVVSSANLHWPRLKVYWICTQHISHGQNILAISKVNWPWPKYIAYGQKDWPRYWPWRKEPGSCHLHHRKV